MSARRDALQALIDEPPSSANWRRLLGILLHWPAEPARDRYVAEADHALRAWPDERRTLSPALKRRLREPPYPSWLGLVRVFDMTRRANRIREYDSLVRLLDEGRIERLHALRLRYCTFGDAGLALIAKRVRGLAKLGLGNCCIGSAGVMALVESPHAAGLVDVNLHSNLVNDVGADAIVEAKALASLRRVNLYNNQISAAGLERARQAFVARGIRFISHRGGGWAFGR